MSRKAPTRRMAWFAAVPALALTVAGLGAAGVSAGAAQAPGTATDAKIGAGEYYINYAEPAVEAQSGGKEKKDKDGVYRSGVDQAKAYDRKFRDGNPVTARQLAKAEAKAVKTGVSPKAQKEKSAKTKAGPFEAKLLTILVEYNESANDDFTGVMVPRTVFEDRTCVPGQIVNGPVHNKIPDPAKAAHKDNNTMWVPDFSPDYFNKMLYTDEGITERVRPDLTGPDGKKGIDISKNTMANMYEEMSKNTYTVTGSATPWVKLDHSEGWYAASRCRQDDAGAWVAPAQQDMAGHPDNPGGAGTMAKDAVDKLAAAQPDFPWADYDIEDQGDRDGDGNVNEPDGVVDHLVLVHAGEDKSGGGGAEGIYSIWAHSSAIANGYTVPGTDVKVSNYIVQPENSGVGVFAHEYGHDLGLPDLYDTTSGGESAVDFWDLMSSGSHSGPIFQSQPAHMGLWDKWVLGWADPVEVNPGDRAERIKVGQTSGVPRGTEDGVKVNLPDKHVTLETPHSGTKMYHSSADQAWADVRLTREVAVPAGAADAKFWMWNSYSIEEDWDYGFVEVSTDGGTTWTEKKVFDAAGNEVSTPDGDPDPNGRLHDYGDKKYGLTGHTDWRHDYVDLGSHAGSTVQVRLRYATDAGFEDAGWFADDFSLTAGGSTVWSDDVEGGDNGWTKTTGTFTDTSGAGWVASDGLLVSQQYYLVEWRNFHGFDRGLQYTYDTDYSREDAWQVQRVKYNAPGALIWYRDTAYGSLNDVLNHTTSLPSYGSKGGLLLVDSHFDPYRRQGEAAAKDPSTLDNIPSRPQTSNAAFGLKPTYAFTECYEPPAEAYALYCTDFAPQPAVSTFTDSTGWVPGIEVRGSSLFYRDIDASVVVPSKEGAPYTTRVVNQDGTPAAELYGLDLDGAAVPGGLLGTGKPADSEVGYGTEIKVERAGPGNTFGWIKVTPPKAG